MTTRRLISKLNSAACYGYRIAQLVSARNRHMQAARNVRYTQGPGWITELPYNVLMARKANHELVEQLKMLQAHMHAPRLTA